jgi:hypothetical protein
MSKHSVCGVTRLLASCEILGFHFGVDEVSILLGYDSASLDNWFLKFRDTIVISYSRVSMSEERRRTGGCVNIEGWYNQLLDNGKHWEPVSR